MNESGNGGGELRDIVSQRVGMQWQEFAERHPHLAAVVERVRLVDTTVSSIRADPEFQRAMEAAGRDEASAAITTNVAAIVDRLVRRALGL